MSMLAHCGGRLSELLDKGLNLVSLLPPDDVVGVGASYFSGPGMVTIEQSPWVADPHKTRLRILGAIAGSKVYGDESSRTFALSNNVAMPDGTHAQLQEPKESEFARDAIFLLSEDALKASYEVSKFIGNVSGKLSGANLRFNVSGETRVQVNVQGTFTSDEMLEDYVHTLGNGVIAEEVLLPTTAHAVASRSHTVLTPQSAQLITFFMYDHRPGVREEMLRLKEEGKD